MRFYNAVPTYQCSPLIDVGKSSNPVALIETAHQLHLNYCGGRIAYIRVDERRIMSVGKDRL